MPSANIIVGENRNLTIREIGVIKKNNTGKEDLKI